jgi:hypothetical protein
MPVIEAAGIERTGQSQAPGAVILQRGRRRGKLQCLPGFLPRIEETGTHRPVDPPPIAPETTAQQPDTRKRVYAVDAKARWGSSRSRRDRDLHRVVGHAAHPFGRPENRAVHGLHEGRAAPGLEPDQRAHGVVEKARGIAQSDPAVPGDKFHRFDPQPSSITCDGVRRARDLEVRNEAQRGIRSGTLHCQGRFPAGRQNRMGVTPADVRRTRSGEPTTASVSVVRCGSGAAPSGAEATHAPLRPDVAVAQCLPPADSARAAIGSVIARIGAIWSIVSISPDRERRYQHQRGKDHRDRKLFHLTAP